MARMLFLPVLIIILVIIVFLALRVKSMFALSKSKDIVLFRPAPYGGDVGELAGTMLKSVNSLTTVEYQTEIRVNYRRIINFSRTAPGSGYSKFTWKGGVVEFLRENDVIGIKTGKAGDKSIPLENRWVDFWCGTSPLEENMKLFWEDGLKITAGNVGSYTQRNYTEIIVLTHAMSPRSNQAFKVFAPHMARMYGKNLAEPGVNIRNFMMKILVNNLTCLPDYIETKFNVFKDSEFICDYLQNSRLLY